MWFSAVSTQFRQDAGINYDSPHNLQVVREQPDLTQKAQTAAEEGREGTVSLPLCRGRSVGSSHGQTQDSLAPTPALSPAPRWYKLYQCWRYLETTSASQGYRNEMPTRAPLLVLHSSIQPSRQHATTLPSRGRARVTHPVLTLGPLTLTGETKYTLMGSSTPFKELTTHAVFSLFPTWPPSRVM